jgi:putative hydrolase of the HAD superfamily
MAREAENERTAPETENERTGPGTENERTGPGTENGRTGLLIDWGGVLTTNLWASFGDYCVRSEIDPQAMVKSFRENPECRELLIGLEKGTLDEAGFEQSFATILGVEPEGLVDGLFAGVGPDEVMIEAVRKARGAGVRTGLISNSWGVHRYPHELFAELFDGIVISGQEGIRKPSRRMYELGAERAGVAAEQCVYVDDIPFNLAPAEKLGMATVHHTSSEITVPELERLLGVALA